ncbi:MAG: zinc ABC transporter substrate-binding protein [Actinobacteria bacterium]|nr:zinc ABC transporter substrate-binding protein [Actinomycetota bacterium]
MRQNPLLLILLLSLWSGTAACGGPTEGREILATTPLWAEITSTVACGHPVESLIPRGTDHHGFEPSLADRGRLDAALLVVANGGGLEGGLDDTLAATPTPIHRIVGEDGDPHIWLDPISVAEALPALAEVIIGRVGLDPVAVEACRLDLDAMLRSLDVDIRERLAAVPAERRRLVTDHAMLGRFADRYRLEVLGTVLESHSSMAETSAHDLEALADVMRNQGIAVIAIEAGGHDDDARRLAERTGAATVDVPLLLGPEGSPTGTYEGMLRSLAERLDGALRSQAGG